MSNEPLHCSVCDKPVADEDAVYFGGPSTGWFTVELHGRPAVLAQPTVSEWHVCSTQCLEKFSWLLAPRTHSNSIYD